MSRNYDLINSLNPKLNAFALPHNHYTTMRFGYLYPICYQECVPGDIYDLDLQAMIRVQPLIAPIMTNMTCEIHAFFVPSRLLWDDFVKYMTTVDDTTIPPTPYEGSQPVWAQSDKDKSLKGIIVTNQIQGTTYPQATRLQAYRKDHPNVPFGDDAPALWDYLGFSRRFSTGAVEEARPVDYLRRCYYFIYNEWFRDENLQEAIDFKNDNEIQWCLYSSWQKDYFTSAFYDRQKGIAPALPITGYANTNFTVDSLPSDVGFDKAVVNSQQTNTGSFRLQTTSLGTEGVNQVATFGFTQGQPTFPESAPATITMSDSKAKTFAQWLTANNDVDLTNLGTFSVNDMRDMFAIQRFLEGLMRGGSRYIEFLQYNYGVSPSDARLSIPERIGSISFNIQVDEVLQSSESANTPQGNQSGHATGVIQNQLGNYKCEEFGYILLICRIRPPAVYVDRIPKEFFRKSLLEQYSPYFVNLSYQAIYQREIWAQGNTNNTTGDAKIFGYQGRYDEMRERQSYVTGMMYNKLAYYANFRTFKTAPALNSEFLACVPDTDIFAVTDEDPFICNFFFDFKSLRPLPLISEPGLIDHVYGA